MKIAITGATGGIGKALAFHYASPENQLFLTGRSKQLEAIAEACRRQGCQTENDFLDLQDEDLLAKWIDKIDQAGVNLVILNAGVSASVYLKDGKYFPEPTEDLSREFNVDATIPITTANRLVEKRLSSTAKSDLQICLVSSLMGLTGFPGSPGYCSAKAAVRTYGLALRRLLKTTGIKINVVLPGYVESPMSRRFKGAKLFMISAEKAAEIIADGLQKNKGTIVFPKILGFGIWLLEILPEWTQGIFLKPFFFTVEPDKESVLNKNKK